MGSMKWKNPLERETEELTQYTILLRDSKSLTPRIYHYVGDIFRHLYGERAGWAHSLLFAAELPAYRKLLPPEMQKEMNDYRELEKQERQEKKLTKSQTGTSAKINKGKKNNATKDKIRGSKLKIEKGTTKAAKPGRKTGVKVSATTNVKEGPTKQSTKRKG